MHRRIYLPVPSIIEVCGLLLALSYTNKAVWYDSATSGVNVTLIVHFPLAARLVVQVVAETAKGAYVVIVMPVSATVCMLVKVNVFAALVVPTFCAT